jgi:hypothetical protein
VKQLLPIYNNLQILIFTSNKAKGEQTLKEQAVPKINNIQVTVETAAALAFLAFLGFK